MRETDAVPRATRRARQPGFTGSPGAVDVTFEHGECCHVRVRGHELAVDQPVEAGGDDAAPTPVELFVASVAASAGFCAGRYLARHDMPREGLRVSAEFRLAVGAPPSRQAGGDRPARVGRLGIRLSVPGYLTQTRRKALEAVVRHCTVHNTLHQLPDITFELE